MFGCWFPEKRVGHPPRESRRVARAQARLLLALAYLVALGNPCRAAESHSVVIGLERETPDRDLVSDGLVLLGELNCTSCHAPPDGADILAKQAPILDEVGSRVRPEYLRRYLSDPQRHQAGTTMPSVWSGVEAAEREARVEALTHLLASTGNLQELAPLTSPVNKGESLFHQVGCVGCHDPQHGDMKPLATSRPLGDLPAKYSIPGLARFLLDPLHSRPSGRMPGLRLSQDEARSIASFLLRDLKAPTTLRFSYYEGQWDRLPDFAGLKPKTTGVATSFDVNVGRPDGFALRFEGTLRIQQEGDYTFHLGSDDGSRLSIAGETVAAVDGIHPLTFASGKRRLQAGRHAIVVEYFEQGGEQELRLEIEGPGLARQPAEFALVGDEADEPTRLVPEAKLVARGREVFVSTGCARCHKLRDASATDPAAPPLVSLTADAGCLARQPKPGVPHYSLTDAQRRQLAAALAELKRPSRDDRAAESRRVARTLTALNCYACHERGGRGGVEELRNAHFKTNQPEMGDEGRLPPTLTGVGAKLQAEWLRQLFEQGSDDRPAMITRMPRFGGANLAGLAESLERLDPPASRKAVATAIPPPQLKSAGRFLSGDTAFSCVKCHNFANRAGTGIQAISLTTMTRRLKEDWFHQYMLDPQAFRRGTRMPASWPNGQVLLPKLLDGQADTQVHSLWVYLADGDAAAIPVGFSTAPLELKPLAEPLIYRNFIEGAGARAIGVGYPERVNLAFDANQLRLALVWHNAFIDASRHWTGRGEGFQAPLGDNVLTLPEGVPLATLDGASQVWPNAPARQLGYQFRGYHFDDRRRPRFLYSVGPIQVEDQPEPASDQAFTPLKRTIRLTQAGDASRSLHFRAAVGRIQVEADGWFRVDDRWRVKLSGGPPPIVRGEAGAGELLQPIEFREGRANLVEEIQW